MGGELVLSSNISHLKESDTTTKTVIVGLLPDAHMNRWRPLSSSVIGPFSIVENIKPNGYYENGIHPGFTVMDSRKQMGMCRTLDNCFHYSKVRKIDLEDGTLQRSFFSRRAFGFASTRMTDFVSLKDESHSYHDGSVREWRETRRYFCHYYSHILKESDMFGELMEIRRSGGDICIISRDAPDGDTTITAESCTSSYRSPLKYGDGWILSSLLLGVEPWK